MFNLHNRRYLGSKYKLLDFIDEVVTTHCSDAKSFVDIFSGTGVVAQRFNNRFALHINDMLKTNVLAYQAFFANDPVALDKLKLLIAEYNSINLTKDNYYSINFADTYLSKANMRKVGYIREDIESKYINGIINAREKAILITSLLFAIDRIANTVGHYDAYRKEGDLSKPLILDVPDLDDSFNNNNNIYQLDANQLAPKLGSVDIVYLDPPYNSRQYGDAYHFLENVATHLQPEVFGVARKMDRQHLKSDFCTSKAIAAFKDLISNLDCKYILVSYNNTGTKINARSNAKISDQQILETLQSRGDVEVFETAYNVFTTGKTQINEHTERLFLCKVTNKPQSKIVITHNKSESRSFVQDLDNSESIIVSESKSLNSTPLLDSLDSSKNLIFNRAFVPTKEQLISHGNGLDDLFLQEISIDNEEKKETKISSTVKTKKDLESIVKEDFIKSPLNYTGGKGKLITQLANYFPKGINVFYDLFCGGLNVGINVQAEQIKAVDINPQLIELLHFLQQAEPYQLIEQLQALIATYGLSDSATKGYAYYGCDSSKGLGSYNKEAFLNLRTAYNRKPSPLLLLLLIIFSFNNQIRFNSKGEFNLPVGKRDFNPTMQAKLIAFCQRAKELNLTLIEQDFRKLDPQVLADERAFLYLDPPYFLGLATYNENGGWTEKDEIDLLNFLLACHDQGVPFALSNVIKHKGQTHKQLIDWCIEHHFNLHFLEYSYSNASYQRKNQDTTTAEVLITNYAVV